jgi:hypothetical protein
MMNATSDRESSADSGSRPASPASDIAHAPPESALIPGLYGAGSRHYILAKVRQPTSRRPAARG